MDKKKNYTGVVASLIIVLVACISIGYAALSTQVNVTGTTLIKTNSWNMYVSAVATPTTTGAPTVTKAPSVTSGSTSTTSLSYNVTLNKPGDAYTFNFTVKNGGTINAKLSAVPTLTGLTTAQDVYVNHTITNSDGSAVTAGQTINAGATKTYTVKVEFDKNITAAQLPTSDQSLTLGVALNYVQA